MDNNYKPNPTFKLVRAILNLICALVLVGIGIFYGVSGDETNLWIFLAVGAVFLGLSGISLYGIWKQKKEEEAEKNNEASGNKKPDSGKGTWDMNTVGGNKR